MCCLIKTIGKSIICCIIMFFMMMSFALADDFTAYIEFNPEKNEINYKGNSGNVPSKSVNATLIIGDEDPNVDNVVSIDSVLTGKNGAFEGTIYLDKNVESGTYKIFIDSQNGSYTKSFVITDENISKQYLKELNSKKNVEEFEEYLKDNSEKFGILFADYSESFSFNSEVVFSVKPVGGYALSMDVYSEFMKADAIYTVINSEDIEIAIENKADVLEIDYAEYSELDHDAKYYLNELLKKADYTSDAFEVIFKKNLIYADIKTSEKWTALKESVLKYEKYLGINLDGKYKSLQNKDAVFQNMFKEDLDDFDSILLCFDKSVNECYKNEQAGSKGGGSSSSKGGGSGFMPVDVTVNPDIAKSQGSFSDIDGHWAYEYINELYECGAVNGYEDGTFRPDSHITRAEFTQIIVNAFKIEKNGEDFHFKDVSANDWFYDCVGKASSNSLILGYDGMFCPDNNITRQDAVLIVYRLLNQNDIVMSGSGSYIDSEKISDYAVDAVLKMTGAGIISGNEGRFLPLNYITRAEATKIIMLSSEMK